MKNIDTGMFDFSTGVSDCIDITLLRYGFQIISIKLVNVISCYGPLLELWIVDQNRMIIRRKT